MTRTLLLMRHGKAAWPDDVADFDRPLAPRGRREAALAGDWIRKHVGEVDHVLCSSSRRTRETLAASGIEAATTFEDAIYEGWPGGLLDVVRGVDPAARTVLLVGHAPGTPGLAERLASDDTDPALVREISAGFPTSAIAALEVEGDWATLDPGTALLTHYVVPR